MTRRLAPVLVALLALTACSNSGEPEAFDEQPVPVGAELGDALGTGADAELPVIERNFLEGCVLAGSPEVVGATDLPASCQCIYDGLVRFYLDFAESQDAENVEAQALDAFVQLDDDLAAETEQIPANIQAIIDGCAA